MTGTVFSQGVQFAASLILTRLYTPAEFGQYAAVLSIATVLGSLIVLAYPTAIPLAETDEESRLLTWLGIALASVSAMVTTLVLAGLVVSSVSILGYQPDWRHVVFIPLTAFAVATWSNLQFRQSRIGGFRRVGLATASGACAQVGSQIVTGWLGFGSSGLSFGYLLGRLLNVALLLRGGRLGGPPGLQDLRRIARAWSDMPRWLLLPTVMNILGTSAITPWVAGHYGLSAAGSFAFALQMLSVPAALIGQAVATILFPRLAHAERRTGVESGAMEHYVTRLASVALAVFVPVLVLGPELFTLAFGRDWAQAGIIAAILSPWIAANFVSSPLSSLAVVKGRYRMVALIATVETAARFSAIALGSFIGSELAGFALYSLVGIAISTNYIAWTLRLTGGSLAALAKKQWRAWVLSALAVAALLVARMCVPMWTVMALTVALTLAMALIALRGLRRPQRGR